MSPKVVERGHFIEGYAVTVSGVRPQTRAMHASRRVVVICPMEIERSAVKRAARERKRGDLDVIRSGIGKQAIVTALEQACSSSPVGLAILAGACGALDAVEDVPSIARVIDEHGRTWQSPFGMDDAGVTLIAVDRIVSTRTDKIQLAKSSGATIVDMESHAFAEACDRIGVVWTVVRGVSDTVDEMLPAQVLKWIASDGRTRTMRAATDLMLNPWLIPHMRKVLARSRRVLPRVGARVIELHDTWLAHARA